MSFTYEATNILSGQDRFRHFVALYGSALGPDSRLTKHGDFTILATLPEETYLAETGIGFLPEAVMFMAANSGGTAEENYFYIGSAARGGQWGIRLFHPYLSLGTPRLSAFSDREILYGVGEFNSWDSDGFTFNLPNPIVENLTVDYFAMAGGGGYHCGSAQGRTTNGLQALTGFGFRPSAAIFVSSQVPIIGETTDFARLCIGAGDDQGNEFCVWAGSHSFDVHTNQIAQSGKVMALTEDANVFTPFNPVIQAEATIDSFDSDGLTLNWTDTDGVGRYFGWLAFQNAEVGRFIFNSMISPATVSTAFRPSGLIFFMNDLAHEELSQYSPSTEGSSLALGFCDKDLSGQQVAGYADVSRGPFFSTQTANNSHPGDSMGCMEAECCGLVNNELRDRGRVIELEGVFNPIVGMNMRYADREGSSGRLLLRPEGPGS